jgi:hypothetical protein
LIDDRWWLTDERFGAILLLQPQVYGLKMSICQDGVGIRRYCEQQLRLSSANCHLSSYFLYGENKDFNLIPFRLIA